MTTETIGARQARALCVAAVLVEKTDDADCHVMSHPVAHPMPTVSDVDLQFRTTTALSRFLFEIGEGAPEPSAPGRFAQRMFVINNDIRVKAYSAEAFCTCARCVEVAS